MKKYIILILMILALTGCTNLKNLNYNQIVDTTFEEKALKNNTYLEGYKFYLPENMTMIGDLKGNNILFSNGDKYYLYVDLISYYNKKQNRYDISKNNYVFTRDLDYNDLKGYVLVSNSKGGYLVETMYNYAKIEVVTKDIKSAIVNSLIILKSINYNYKIIDSMIGSNTLVYDSKMFTLLGPDKKKDNFLQYVEEYGDYDEEDFKNDEDVIEMESSN